MATPVNPLPSEILHKWQEIVNLLAEIMHVPAALVMKVDPPEIKVLVSSESAGNPYERNEAASLNTGLYCETVMKTRQSLLVPDALHDDDWKSNPDIKLGMISYLGFPVTWPDGKIFGTICVLDSKRNEYGELYKKLLLYCRDVLQADLQSATSIGEELAARKAHFDELFEQAPEGIVLLDVEDRVRRINPEFTRIFGYSPDEAVGQAINDLIAPEDLRSEAEEYTQRIIHGEKLNAETTRRRKDGGRVPVSLLAIPISVPGGQIAEYAIYRDVSERKRLENELKHERDRLRVLLDLTNSLVSRLDLRQLVETISTDLLRIMQCDQCALLLGDPESGQLRTTMLYNSQGRGEKYEGMIVPMIGSVSGKVFRTGKGMRVNNFEDLRDDPEVFGNPEGQRFFARVMGEGLKSGCFLPLVNRNRTLGVMHVSKGPESGFTDDDFAFLQQVAHQIAIAVDNALDYGKAKDDRDKETQQKLYLRDEIRAEYNFGEIIGESRALKAVLDQVAVVAPTDSSVLILGETGTGKELIARAIHDMSARRDRPFVKLNCAAIPLGLLESELFGHEKGAFTGAIAQKVGRFELANKGTLFLDEVGDIHLELQAKLLRVLQEREFERLGSNRTHKVDVRIIAATHRDLAKMVEQQVFRNDLYYRLKVFPIPVPPLRQRAEDIAELTQHFVSHYARQMNKKIETIPGETIEALVKYQWPGNVRELQNFVERAVILSPGLVLCAPVSELEPAVSIPALKEATGNLAQAEREHILRALEECNWVVGGRKGAAARLGLKRTSLVYKMQKLGISRSTAAGT